MRLFRPLGQNGLGRGVSRNPSRLINQKSPADGVLTQYDLSVPFNARQRQTVCPEWRLVNAYNLL